MLTDYSVFQLRPLSIIPRFNSQMMQTNIVAFDIYNAYLVLSSKQPHHPLHIHFEI